MATSCEPRPTLISCVAATMLRTTTVSNAGFVAPQYFALRLSVICDVVENAESTSGPLPSPTDADEFSHDSALSFLLAPTDAVAPCCFTGFELTTPRDRLAGIAAP